LDVPTIFKIRFPSDHSYWFWFECPSGVLKGVTGIMIFIPKN
jgi:hypothetical protein